ncbi:MAG: hypothetical protein U0990_09345 [Candidatus Nanopelagicales bacterium]|nr:hypothetical protein [Candidatus Nanopelagicales bacterium]
MLPAYIARFEHPAPQELVVVEVRPDGAAHYRCPCGATDHYAVRSPDPEGQVGDGYADVLHCFETGKMWHCGAFRAVNPNVHRVQKLIHNEEELYIRLLNAAPKSIKRFLRHHQLSGPADLTGELLAILHHTHGLDPTIVEGATGVEFPQGIHNEYLAAIARHRNTGKGGT